MEIVPDYARNQILSTNSQTVPFVHIASRNADVCTEELRENTEQEFIVEKILKRRFVASDNCYKWLVEWGGFDNSWEPESCFVDKDGAKNDVWKDFEAIHTRRKRIVVTVHINKLHLTFSWLCQDSQSHTQRKMTDRSFYKRQSQIISKVRTF